MKYCNSCGAENKNERENCHWCGAVFNMNTKYMLDNDAHLNCSIISHKEMSKLMNYYSTIRN